MQDRPDDGRTDEERIQAIHHAAVSRQQIAHVLDAEIALDDRFHQVTDRGAHRDQGAERDTDPPRFVEEKGNARGTGNGTEQDRPGEALPGLLWADLGRHRMLAEKHARDIPADVGAHGDEDEGDDPRPAVIGGEHHGGEAAEQARVEGGKDAPGDIATRAGARIDHAPYGNRRARQAEGDDQGLRTALMGGVDHAGRADGNRDDRDDDLLDREGTHQFPDAHDHRDGDDDGEGVLGEEQAEQDHRAEPHADTDRLRQVAPGAPVRVGHGGRSGRALRDVGRAGRRGHGVRISDFEQFGFLVLEHNIDLIDICNPTHLHPEHAIRALEAGKHVLVEKAIALTTQEADAMVAAAKKANKLLMVAHVLPFFPEFKYAAEVIRTQKFGKLLAGHFTRIISKPDWSADIGDAAKTGGPAVDLHVHDTHFIGLACGVPKSVFATGVVENGVVQHLTTSYAFGSGGPSVTCTSGALTLSGRPFVHGYELFFEKATLVYDSNTCPLTLITAGKTEPVTLPGGGDAITAFAEEIQTAVNGVTTGQMPDLLSGQLARDALVMCYKDIEAVQSGKSVLLG